MALTSESKNIKDDLTKIVKKGNEISKRRTLRDILTTYFENTKKLEKPAKESSFIEDINLKMKEKGNSYNSMLEVHKVLSDAYNQLTNKEIGD